MDITKEDAIEALEKVLSELNIPSEYVGVTYYATLDPSPQIIAADNPIVALVQIEILIAQDETSVLSFRFDETHNSAEADEAAIALFGLAQLIRTTAQFGEHIRKWQSMRHYGFTPTLLGDETDEYE